MPKYPQLRFLLLVPMLGALMQARAGNPVTWAFAAMPAGGDTVQVQLQATCEPGWHIYALQLPSDQGPLPTEVHIAVDEDYRVIGTPTEPPPVEADDPNFAMKVRYHGGVATFVQQVMRNTPGRFTINGTVAYMACNDRTCLPPRSIPFSLPIPSIIQ